MSTSLLQSVCLTLLLLLAGGSLSFAEEKPPAEPPAKEASEDAAEEAAPAVEEESADEPAEDKAAEEAAPTKEEKPATEEEPAATEEEDKPAAEDKAAEEKPAAVDDPENPGITELNQAIEMKLDADDLQDLNEVVDLLDGAIEKGLDAENSDFAEEMLVATLLQRAASFSQVVLSQPIADPRRDPRWIQVRQYALTDLQRVVALDPKQIQAWLLLGRLQSLPLGSPSEARRALTQVIRLAEEAAKDPEMEAPEPSTIAQAYALRGATQKDGASRLADFNKAIELDPDKEEYLLLRAQAHRADGKGEECLADIEKAIEAAPENPKAYELKALALLMLDRQDEALAAFNKASELAPELLTPYQYRSELLNQQGKIDEAIAELDKSLKLQPNNLASLLIRAQLLSENEEYDKALKDVEAILQQQPALVRAHQMKAQLLDKLGRTDEAVAMLEKLIAIDPNLVELQLQLLGIYSEKQMAPEAIELATKILESDQDSESSDLVRRLRGDMYLYAGDHEEAIADFELALEKTPNEPGVLNNFAWTLATSPYASVRDGKRAVELATKAAEVTEYAAPHILSTLAASYAEAGDFEQAVKRAEEAIAKATELKTIGDYDGQLEAELQCYKSGQPWRELQKLEVSGPASEADKEIAEAEKNGGAKAGEAKPQAKADAPTPPAVDDTPARSIDF
jgi:tetratricopeptide (TPR) repeat protein